MRSPDALLGDSAPTQHLSEDSMGLVFAQRYRDWFRWVPDWGCMTWDGCLWKRDKSGFAAECAKVVAREMSQTAVLPHQKKSLLSVRSIAAVEKAASTIRKVCAEVADFDTYHHELNTPKGMIDLRTGRMSDCDLTHYHTKCTAVTPSIGGECPKFEKFLDRITDGDVEYQQFLQRHAGYCALGDNPVSAFFFLHGQGANGKTRYVNAIAGALGSYAVAVSPEVFLESRVHTDRHPTELAKLAGVRLATAVEIENGRHWNESRITQLTGGDKMTARFMRQDEFDFTCRAKFNIVANNRPSFKGMNVALARRVYMLPFSVQIPRNEWILDLDAQLAEEYPAILEWLIDGAVSFYENGLNPPRFVQEATKSYLESEDYLTLWLHDKCTTDDPKAWTASSALFTSYSSWCVAGGIRAPGTQHKLISKLVDRFNFQKHERNTGTGLLGLALKPTKVNS